MSWILMLPLTALIFVLRTILGMIVRAIVMLAILAALAKWGGLW